MSSIMSNAASTVRKRQCVALYDCKADNDDELSFREGEVINVISEDEEEWWVSMSLSLTISLFMPLFMYYILPVFLYGAETWSITKAIEKRIDAFDQFRPSSQISRHTTSAATWTTSTLSGRASDCV